MSVPVQGTRLSERMQRRVLSLYVNRWTRENLAAVPEQYRSRKHQTDAEWLASHAFYLTLTGELDRRYRFAEPYYPEAPVDTGA